MSTTNPLPPTNRLSGVHRVSYKFLKMFDAFQHFFSLVTVVHQMISRPTIVFRSNKRFPLSRSCWVQFYLLIIGTMAHTIVSTMLLTVALLTLFFFSAEFRKSKTAAVVDCLYALFLVICCQTIATLNRLPHENNTNRGTLEN